MKAPRVMFIGGGVVAIIAVLGFLIYPSLVGSKKKADIQLRANVTGLNFTGASGHAGNCKSTNSHYCVNIDGGDSVEVKFRLVGSPGWRFTRMQLVAEPSAKLNFHDQKGFTRAMRDEFYVVIKDAELYPDTNGIIDLKDLPNDGLIFTLIDKNSFKQYYKYQLEACKESKCETSDPKFENEG